MNGKDLLVSIAPHVSDKSSVPCIMWKVVVALLPALAGSVYFFGTRSLIIVFCCVVTALVCEYGIQRVRRQEITIDDGSAVLTGLLVAYNLPVSIPLWISCLGTFFAIVFGKHAFGGLGHTILNPALVGRVFLMAAYPQEMTTWLKPGMDGVTGATPLGILKEHLSEPLPSLYDLFIGNIGGCLGETSAFLLLVGALYLLLTRVITIFIPFAYIGTVAVIIWIFGGETCFSGQVIVHILSGGLILGAFFMATDMVTSPMTTKGSIVFGIGCGVLTAAIRLWGGYPEGVSYSILIMNLTVPLLDKWIKPKVFGKK